MNDPSISWRASFPSPNLLATSCFPTLPGAQISGGSEFTRSICAHPITLPIPVLSFGVGPVNFLIQRFFMKRLRLGSVASHSSIGKIPREVSIYSYKSAFLAMNPRGSPKAMSEMTSRVKNCATRAKSRGLKSEPRDMYLSLRRPMKSRRRLSILSSR